MSGRYIHSEFLAHSKHARRKISELGRAGKGLMSSASWRCCDRRGYCL